MYVSYWPDWSLGTYVDELEQLTTQYPNLSFLQPAYVTTNQGFYPGGVISGGISGVDPQYSQPIDFAFVYRRNGSPAVARGSLSDPAAPLDLLLGGINDPGVPYLDVYGEDGGLIETIPLIPQFAPGDVYIALGYRVSRLTIVPNGDSSGISLRWLRFTVGDESIDGALDSTRARFAPRAFRARTN